MDFNNYQEQKEDKEYQNINIEYSPYTKEMIEHRKTVFDNQEKELKVY